MLASKHPLCCILFSALQPDTPGFGDGKLHVVHLRRLLFNAGQAWMLQEVTTIIATIIEKFFCQHSFSSDPWEAGLVMKKRKRLDQEAVESLAGQMLFCLREGC